MQKHLDVQIAFAVRRQTYDCAVPPSAIRGLDLKLATGENHMAKKAAVKKAAAKPAKKAAKKKK